ncbi:MAG TPA: tetratricopeptide repeat protein [Pyrinomonadaceae bacterium]|jgi:tetratricopeptide (TPR) repeat protein
MKQFLAILILISSLMMPAPASPQFTNSKLLISQQGGSAQDTTQSPELAEAQELNNQVLELYKQGKYDKALPLAERVLSIREKVLGADHLLVASSLLNLAEIYVARGKKKEAIAKYQRLIAIYEKNFGTDNPEIVKALDRYVCLLVNVGQRDEALSIQKRIYKIDNGFEYDESNKRADRNLEMAGIIAGSSISSPPPKYLPEAKSQRVTGSVIFKVTVDESGKVVAVTPICGHPLLIKGAEQAIWNSRYQPTMVAGKPVKVTGIAIYNFAL